VTRFAVRGAPADFDDWAARGNAGWSFDEILPHFIRLEADAEFGAERWHGRRGPVPVTRHPEHAPTEIHAAALRALVVAGFPAVGDHNRPGSVGVGPVPMNTSAGQRVTTADAYLPLGGTPPRLAIHSDAQVASVVLDGCRASGVRLVDGTVIRADWVVLCAGTYGSPPILLRSGIGPAEQLRSVGIDVRVDLPGVGANLSDHPEVELDQDGEGRRGRRRSSIPSPPSAASRPPRSGPRT
jgi:choline dehydrogenase